jgi:hypothetical protein
VRNRQSEEEIDDIAVAEAADDFAWEAVVDRKKR